MPKDIIRIYKDDNDQLGSEYYVGWCWVKCDNGVGDIYHEIEIGSIEDEEENELIDVIKDDLFSIILDSLCNHVHKNKKY